MSVARRHAVYWVPAPGPLAAAGAAWLGWDLEAGRAVERGEEPRLPRDAEALTRGPRRYGFHATLKAPFRLASGRSDEELAHSVAALASRLPPARAEGLVLSEIDRFLALVPDGDAGPISALAAEVVAALDAFRAPTSPEELARRRAAGLSAVQEANLVRWGYPHVMGTFRFHVTLTGALGAGEGERVVAALRPRLERHLPRPFVLDALAHVGEGEDGLFRLIGRHPLQGDPSP